MTRQTCKCCGVMQGVSQFERTFYKGKAIYRKSCKDCRREYIRGAQIRRRAVLAAAKPEIDRSYIPPADFLRMGPSANAGLMWSVGARYG